MKNFIYITLIFIFIFHLDTESGDVDILTYENGVRILGVTSQKNDSTYSVKNLLDGSNHTGWRTADNISYPDTIVIELPRVYSLQKFAIDNTNADESIYKGISAKDFELYVSVTSKSEGFRLALSGEAKRAKRKVFKLDNVPAKWLKLIILDNWGNGEHTEIMELEAYGNE